MTKLTLAVAASIVALAVQTSRANSVTYNLDLYNQSGFTGPFGTVTIDLTSSTTANITFTGTSAYSFTDGSSAAVNINASSFSYALISDPFFKQFTSGSADGYGQFNLEIDQDNSSPSDRASSIQFSVTDTSGNWASATDVLALNGTGHDMAAHIYVESTGNNTGFASSDGQINSNSPPPVPDGGSTMIMLGSVMTGLAFMGRKLRKS